MAVYKRAYRRYEGAVTPEWTRFTVPLRFAWEDLRRSRILALLLWGAFVMPMVQGVIIWLRHSAVLTEMLHIPAKGVLAIDERFFLSLLGWQGMLCFFVTAFVGPGLISPDLANRALPLYLSRPFSRLEYVQGGALFFRVARGWELPVWTCWLALAAMMAACCWLLAKKIRGVEVAS